MLGDYPGFKNRMMAGLKSSLSSGCFEVRTKRPWAFLGEKSRDEVRPDIFGATALRQIRFAENFQREACILSILNQILTKQMKNEVNVRRKCGNSCNGPHLRGRFRWFLRDGTLVVLLTKHDDAVTSPQLVHVVGAVGQNRPATLLTQTFPKVSFFLGGCHIYPHLDEVPASTQLLIFWLLSRFNTVVDFFSSCLLTSNVVYYCPDGPFSSSSLIWLSVADIAVFYFCCLRSPGWK
jgi:hypothetical protein